MFQEKYHTDSDAIGITEAITSFERFNSASRTAMSASQNSQRTVPANGPDLPRILTGYEYQEAMFTMGATMPVDGITKCVIPRYTLGHGLNSIRRNSQKTMVYIDQDSGELDCLEIKDHDCVHDVFGYSLDEKPIVRHASREGVPIAKGTKLTTSKAVTDQGIYSSLIQANYCYLSHAPVIEDGIWISEDAVERARPMAYAKLNFEWGKNFYPLNTYGDERTFKPFAAPGEPIKKCGLVAAMRRKCPIFDAIGLLPTELRKVSQFDKKIYAPPESRDATMVDVDVLTTTRDHNRLAVTPIGMESFTRIFSDQKTAYYDRLMATYDDFMRQTNYRGQTTDRMADLLTDAFADQPSHPRARAANKKTAGIQRTKRGTPIDEWSIDVRLEWKFNLGEGGKLTNLHASFNM